jgi:hypothetical protein
LHPKTNTIKPSASLSVLEVASEKKGVKEKDWNNVSQDWMLGPID